mgnify:CR=1 FL=1
MRLQKAASNLCIPEMSYGFGKIIKFDTFTSCIGIVSTANNDKELIGIHLGLFQGSTSTSVDDMHWVESILRWSNYNKQKFNIIGLRDFWPLPILQRLRSLGEPAREPGPGARDGICGASLIHGNILIQCPA